MNCSILESLDLDDLKIINNYLRRRPANFENFVKSEFPSMAKDILEVVEKIKSEGRNEILPEDLSKFVTPEDLILKNEFAVEDDNVETNYNGNQSGVIRMYRKFTDAMISFTIYDKVKAKTATPLAKSDTFENMLNEKIFGFKESLIEAICKFTGVPFIPGFGSTIDFEKKINNALGAFATKQNSGTLTDAQIDSDEYRNALDAYTILKNFDKLLKQKTPFIAVKPGFERSQVMNRYIFKGANTKLDKTWTTNEESSIDEQVSDVVGVLLDYFPEWNKAGKPIDGSFISRTGFYQVMSAFKQWMDTVPLKSLFKEEYPSEGERILRNIALIKSAREGNEAALNKLWNAFVKEHTKDSVGTNFSKNKLRGIDNILNSKSRLNKSFKRMFWNLCFKTNTNIVETTSVLDNTVSNKRIQDNYRRAQWNKISDTVTARIRTFKYTNPELKSRLYREFGIDVNGETITLFKGTDYEVSLEKVGNSFISTLEGSRHITDLEAKKFIEKFLDDEVPEDYATTIEQLAYGGEESTLFGLYGNIIGLVIAGTESFSDIQWNNENDPDRETIKLGSFRNVLTNLQTFLGVAYGTNVSSTLKNEEGNNIAAYTLTSMIHQLGHLLLKLTGKTDSSFKDNLVAQQFRDYVGEPIVRGDVNIKGKKKAARSLNEVELAYVGIVSDFWNSVNSLYSDNKVTEICFQNTTFSDKNTHFKIPYSKYFKINDSLTLGTAIQGIIEDEGRESKISAFKNAIYDSQRKAYLQILDNLILDYKKAFVYKDDTGKTIVDSSDSITQLFKAKTISEKIDAIKAVIKEHGKTAAEKFKKAGIDFVPELHDRINETLFNLFNIYLSTDKTRFNKLLNFHRRQFVKDLENYGFNMNRFDDPGNIVDLQNKLGKSWWNSTTGDTLLYKGDLNGDFELNPMLEAYFWSDVLLSNSFNEIIFGRTWFHPNKYTPKPYNAELGEENDFDEEGNYTEMYYIHAEASRLLSSYKRTVIAGATFHTFFPMKYGTASEIDVATVKDIKASVWNMLGVQDIIKALDGSGLSSPYQAVFENWSLLDAEGGWDKKTIFGDNEGRFGIPNLVKWAVYAITPNRRRMSMGSDIPLETVFRKMHSRPISLKYNLGSYYSYSLTEDSKIMYDSLEGKQLTRTEPLYRYDDFTDTYYLISDVKSTGNTVQWNEYVCNKNGIITNTTAIPRKRDVQSIYDLDQVFGGAYTMVFNEASQELEYDDMANTEVVAKAIAHNELKNSMIGYVINESAEKVGARNINPSKSLFDDEDFWTFKLSMMYGGVQMNADHLLADSDVTEMSQMISALIQNGYFAEDVTEIYREIGQIAFESLGLENKLIEEGDYDEIHLLLGKNLIENFNSGSKDTIGLAQSYLMKASKLLEQKGAKLKIPFSDKSLVGAFYSNLVSNVNKAGIRRRFAGIADVLCPARGMITTFNIGLGSMMWSDFVQHCREQGLTQHPTVYIRNRGELGIDGNFYINGEKHPFIKQTTNRDLEPQDYVIIVHEDGSIEEKKIDNWTTLDLLRNRLTATDKLYKWTCKPRELGQADTTYEINGVRYSIYDLDSVRASHYLEDIIKAHKDDDNDLNLSKLTSEERWKWEFIQNAIKRNLPMTGTIGIDKLNSIAQKVQRELLVDMKTLEKNTLRVQSCFENLSTMDARSWMYYNPKFKKAKLSGNIKTDYAELLLKTNLSPNLKKNFSYFTEFDVPTEVLVALSFDGSDKSLQHIAVDAVKIGLNINTIIELLKTNKTISIDDNLKFTDELKERLVNYYNTALTHNSDKTQQTVTVQNVTAKHAQIIMGRANAEKFGIRKGDSLYQIKKQKEQFFKARIESYSKMPPRYEMDKTKYDAVLVGPSGKKLFVAVREKHSLEEFEGFREANDVFEKRDDGMIYFENTEICESKNKRFLSTTYPGGTSYVMIVDDISEIDELLDSDYYNNVRFNYNENNSSLLFNYQYKDSILEGKATRDIYLNTSYGTIIIKEGRSVNDYVNQISVNQFKEIEEAHYQNRLDYVAKEMWQAFEAQLLCIGARIPTQSMQSFMGMEIVGFSDSDKNEVYVPAVQLWLQGSDLDIDKLYIMMFEISKRGKLQTFTKLQSKFKNIRSAMDLKAPNGVEYVGVNTIAETVEVSDLPVDQIVTVGDITYTRLKNIFYQENLYTWDNNQKVWVLSIPKTNDAYIVDGRLMIWNGQSWNVENYFTRIRDSHEIEASLNFTSTETYNRVLKSGANLVVFEPSLSKKDTDKFINNINKHSLSKISKQQKQVALRNSVVHKILRLMEHPLNMIPAHKPINMESLQRIAEQSTLSKREKVMSSLNPLGKFIMQVQNMVGKDVIGITAVSLKVFFAMSTFINQRVLQLKDAIKDGDIDRIREYIEDITFQNVRPNGSVNTVTLANVNLDPLKELLLKVGDDFELPIMVGGTKKLKDIVDSLSENSSKIDCAEAISQLLSAATDNAKELILSKINATADFADTWSCLMMNGWTVKEIGNYLTSSIFAVVSKFTKASMFTDIIKRVSPEKAVNFVLGHEQLPGIDVRTMKLLLTSYPKNETDNDSFYNKLRYETDENGKLVLDNSNKPILRKNQLLTEEQFEELRTQGSDFRKNIFSILGGENTETALTISKLFLEHINYRLNNLPNDNSEDYYEDEPMEDYQQDQENPDYNEPFDFDDGTDDAYYRSVNSVDYGENDMFKITKKQIRNVLRYVTGFLIPKNELVSNLNIGHSDLKHYRNEILPMVKEQKIIGLILGINQGIKTGEWEFYSRLKQVQNYVNGMFSIEKHEAIGYFDIQEFLTNAAYQKQWIDLMDSKTYRTNPLKLVRNTPHFWAMYRLNGMVDNFMNHAVSHRINLRFEKHLLGNSNQSLSEQEWGVVDKYTHDLIQLNWLFSKGIRFGMPNTWIDGEKRDVQIYTKDVYGDVQLNVDDESTVIALNGPEGAATFVKFFENYIIPTLKQKYNNAFVRNLTTGSVLSKTHNVVVNHAKLKLNTMTADSSAKTKSQYSEILSSFNKIARDEIPGTGLTVQDALFIYNTLVYKNGFTENGFTRLMETVQLVGDNSLINDYAGFVADLDDNTVSTIGIIKEDGSFEFGPLKGHINDLLYRLSFLDTANYKFGVTQNKDMFGAITELSFVDIFGNETDVDPINVVNNYPNDWCLELPLWNNTEQTSQVKGFTTSQKRYSFNSKEVVMAVTDSLIQRFGIQDKVQYITRKDIKEAWERRNDPTFDGIAIKDVKEYMRLKNAKAFLNGGKVYLNMEKIDNSTVLHELMHLICTGMKFSDNQSVKETYYNLIREANDYAKTNPKFYINMQQAYSEERGSDFKEEVLIEILTDKFKTDFRKGFGGLQFSTNITEYVTSVINDVFETSIPIDSDKAKVGNTKLNDLAILFKSGLMDINHNAISSVNIGLSHKLKTLKRILIQAGETGKANYIKYDC